MGCSQHTVRPECACLINEMCNIKEVIVCFKRQWWTLQIWDQGELAIYLFIYPSICLSLSPGSVDRNSMHIEPQADTDARLFTLPDAWEEDFSKDFLEWLRQYLT